MTVIEREILIEAPRHVVWQVLTDPAQISQWFSDDARIDLRPGGAGTFVFGPRVNQLDGPIPVDLVVQAAEPPERFAFRWAHPAGSEARVDNSLLVEFTLTAEGEHTRLRLVESGYDQVDWSPQVREDTINDHAKGWDTHLTTLTAYAPQRSASS
ncbi:SRPBCC domain-containing protein [Micromonospora costi]|nr:SRPBCC domain-containing protein [Micromonospora costi]